MLCLHVSNDGHALGLLAVCGFLAARLLCLLMDTGLKYVCVGLNALAKGAS